MPQCQPGPGRQEKPRLPYSPGLSLRPRFVWFRGLGTLHPHPSLWLLGSLTDPAEVCWPGGKASGVISLFSAAFHGLVCLFLMVGWGEQLGAIGRWGWLGNLFSPIFLC